MFTALAKLAASLAVLAGVLAMPSTSQAAPCEADYCFPPVLTDVDGSYTFYVTPFMVQFFGAEYSDCFWDVEAVFDDGSPSEIHSFDARVGLQATHTFPGPGEYQVDLYAAEGTHTESAGTCPPFHFAATVTVPEPKPPKEPEEEGPEPETPEEEPPPGGGEPPTVAPRPESGGPAAGEEASAPGKAFLRWRQCRRGVQTRKVSCRTGRRVADAALEALAGRRGNTKVEGFTCRLRPTQGRPLSCARGERRILGPVA